MSDINVDVNWIVVEAGGELVMGSADCPISKKVVFTFFGPRVTVSINDMGADNDGCKFAAFFVSLPSPSIYHCHHSCFRFYSAIHAPSRRASFVLFNTYWYSLPHAAALGSKGLAVKNDGYVTSVFHRFTAPFINTLRSQSQYVVRVLHIDWILHRSTGRSASTGIGRVLRGRASPPLPTPINLS